MAMEIKRHQIHTLLEFMNMDKKEEEFYNLTMMKIPIKGNLRTICFMVKEN